jgi:hypothetical protein
MPGVERSQGKSLRARAWLPLAGGGLGLVIALLAGLASARAGVASAIIAQDQIVGIAYVVAGALAWRRRPGNATGPLLLAVGGSWYISDFQAVPVPPIAALAFATRRLVNALSASLMLVFPSGRLGRPAHRVAMGFVAVIAAIQVPPRLLLIERIPADLQHVDRISMRGCDCVNPFQIASAPWLYHAIEWAGALLSVAGAVIVMGLVVLRLTGATPPMRRVLWPVLFGAIVGLTVFAYNLLSSMLTTSPPTTAALSQLLSVARAAVPIGFLVGLLRMRMDKAAVADLVVGLHGERPPGALERSIASALHDPSAQLGYWSPAAGAYMDATGKLLAMPSPGSGRSVSYVERADRPLGAIIHDAALDDDTALLDAVSAAFALAVERDRLASTVHAQTADAGQLPAGPVTFLYADIEGSTPLLHRL